MRTRIWRAFTLVELVIVIAIIGILAAVAIPRFLDLRTEAHTAQMQGVVSAVRSGILLVASKNQAATSPQNTTFPPNLEADWGTIIGNGTQSANGTACNADECFELVIPGGVNSAAWVETSTSGSSPNISQVYTYTNPVSSAATGYTYSQANGTFQ